MNKGFLVKIGKRECWVSLFRTVLLLVLLLAENPPKDPQHSALQG